VIKNKYKRIGLRGKPKKYINTSRGQKCGGVCDSCNTYKPFIVHSIGIFCSRCRETMERFKGKFSIQVMNFFKIKYCMLCSRREPYMWKINFGFCRDCFARVGRYDHRTSAEQNEISRAKMRKYHKKIDFRKLSDEEYAERLKEAKKKRIKELS